MGPLDFLVSAQLAFFWISMLLASLASFGSIGLIGCGLLGFAAKFPSEYVIWFASLRYLIAAIVKLTFDVCIVPPKFVFRLSFSPTEVQFFHSFVQIFSVLRYVFAGPGSHDWAVSSRNFEFGTEYCMSGIDSKCSPEWSLFLYNCLYLDCS